MPHIHSPSANGHKSPPFPLHPNPGILSPCFQSGNGELRAKTGSQLLHFHVLWLSGLSSAASPAAAESLWYTPYDRYPYKRTKFGGGDHWKWKDSVYQCWMRWAESSMSTICAQPQLFQFPSRLINYRPHAWWNFGSAVCRVAGGHHLTPCINLHAQMCPPAGAK